jgi:hypothetical protein
MAPLPVALKACAVPPGLQFAGLGFVVGADRDTGRQHDAELVRLLGGEALVGIHRSANAVVKRFQCGRFVRCVKDLFDTGLDRDIHDQLPSEVCASMKLGAQKSSRQ